MNVDADGRWVGEVRFVDTGQILLKQQQFSEPLLTLPTKWTEFVLWQGHCASTRGESNSGKEVEMEEIDKSSADLVGAAGSQSLRPARKTAGDPGRRQGGPGGLYAELRRRTVSFSGFPLQSASWRACGMRSIHACL